MQTQKTTKKILAAVLAVAMMVTTLVPVRQVTADTTTVEPGAANITFDTASDLVFNTTIAEELSGSDKKRYYKFSLSEASILTVGLQGQYVYIDIYDQSRTSVYHIPGKSKGSYTNTIYLTGGDYYLGTETEYSYTIFVTVDSLSESFQETYDVNNDTIDTSSEITVGKQYKGVLAQNDDKDYYKFTLTDLSNLTVNITNGTASYLDYIVYDSFGNQLYDDYVQSNGKADDTIQLAAGTYYLAITKDSVYTIGSYNFSLSAVKIVEKPTTTNKPSTTTKPNETTKPPTTTTNTPKIAKPKKVTIKSMKNKAPRKIVVKWKKLPGVSGYEVQFSNKKNFKKIILSDKYSSKKSSASYANAKKKKTYYVRIRAYVTANGVTKYGAWSAKKKVKVKK